MIRLAAGENFNFDIVRGLLLRKPDLDIVRIQDVNLSGTEDPVILEWVAQEGRILLTHDFNTLIQYVYERVKSKKIMPGVFEISRSIPISLVIEDIILIAECSEEKEWEDQIIYFPLR